MFSVAERLINPQDRQSDLLRSQNEALKSEVTETRFRGTVLFMSWCLGIVVARFAHG